MTVPGSGQAVIGALLDATNLLASGKVLVVLGWDREAARAARALRARVIVCCSDPLEALEAHRDGFDVLPPAEALAHAELVIAREVDADLLREGAVVGGGALLPGEEARGGVIEHVRPDGTSVFVVDTSGAAHADVQALADVTPETAEAMLARRGVRYR